MDVQTTWGAKLIAQHVDAPSTIRVNASDMDLDGFIDDTFSEYRERSVVRTILGGSIASTAPSCGLRYLGFVILDSLTVEQVEISIDGVKKGVAVVNGNNQRERLFTLTEPYNFQGGEQIRLSTPQEDDETESHSEGVPGDLGIEGRIRTEVEESYRIDCVAFFSDLPPENDLPSCFAHINADPIGSSSTDVVTSARVTWITTWDAKCTIEYWQEGSDNANIVEEMSAGANHRIVLSELKPNTRYHYRLNAVDRHGKLVQSPTRSLVTSIPKPAARKATTGKISLAVKNPGEIPCISTPVRSGIPFPQGVLTSSDQLRLLDTDGSEVQLQTCVLGQWPDHSIKWALLDFQTDTPTGSEHIYTLEYGSEITRSDFNSPLIVIEDEHAITIDTGRLNISFDKSRFAPFDKVALDNGPYISSAHVVVNGTDGNEYLSTNARPDSVEVEDSGPMCCIVRTEGHHLSRDGRSLLKSIFRVHAYSGLPFIRIDHTFVNDNSGKPFTDIDSMYLDLETPPGDNQKTELIQTHDDRAMVNGKVRGERLDGKVSVAGIDVDVVDFWQQYPKSLSTHGEGIQIGICPAIGDYDYDVGGEEEYKLYFYLRDGVYRFREGVSKTHTMYIGESLPPLPTPMAQAPVDWSCDSGAFGEVSPGNDGLFPDYEERVADSFSGYLENHETSREYGMLNHGDWTFDSYKDWGNNEYDTAYVFFIQWARSGDIRFFEEACRASVHHRDVDTCHAAEEALRIGGVYRHRIGHTGDHHPGGYGLMEHAIATGEFPATELWVDSVTPRELRAILTWGGEFTISHTWIDGFLLHHFLTGDPRSLEAARMVADRYDGHYTRNYDFANCRNNGWHLILTMEMYKATGDEFYLNAGRIIVERTLERQTEDGGWRRLLVPAHCRCDPPRHTGNASFAVGILLVGLKSYHQATGDPRVAESIVRAADFLIDSTWVEEARGFRSTSCPYTKVSSDNFQNGLAGICYAWRISRKPRFEHVLRHATPKAIEALHSHGRSLSSQMRAAPEVLYTVAQIEA